MAEPLTVRALIEELEKCDPNRLVYMEDDCLQIPVRKVVQDYEVGDQEDPVVFLEWNIQASE
jgi:hypothetical protein